MKILVSGGHLTPALAFIDYVSAHHQDEIVFVGRIYSQDATKQLSQERAEVEQRGLRFVPFIAPRLHQPNILDRILFVFALGWAVLSAVFIVIKERPQVFVSFGSYVAVPLAIACFLLDIPIITHEQTRAMGEATRFISKLAKKVALSFDQPTTLPKQKVEITGLPLRKQLFDKQTKPDWIPTTSKPILYITGGNQGSEILNTSVSQILRPLTKNWFVIHQCGNPTSKREYRRELERQRNQLPSTLQGDYIIKEWVSQEEVGWIYQHARGVIARSGANTVLELIALQVPSILIPLPFSHNDEQLQNARYAADVGGSILLLQKDLTASSLSKAAEALQRYGKSMRNKLSQIQVPTDGDKRLYDLVVKVLNKSKKA